MRKKTLLAYIISFVLLVIVIVLNRYTFHEMKVYSDQVDHTREVITTFHGISNNFKSAQIYSPTFDSGSLRNYYQLYRSNAQDLPFLLSYLRELTKDNPQQVQRTKDLEQQILKQLPVLMQKNIQQIISSGETWRLDALFAIHKTIEEGIKHESTLLQKRKKELNDVTSFNNLLTTAFGVIAAGIILITFISNLFMSRRRRFLEGFLGSILDTSQNGIVHYKAVREQGKIVDFTLAFVNKAVDRLLGIKAEQLTGKRLSEFPSYIRRTDLFDKYIHVVETGEPEEFETLYKSDKLERWFLVSMAKLDDGVIASFHDISQLKKYEAELKENISSLEKSNTELEQYAYVASHDLQEPLRKIRSFGSYLQDTQSEKLDEKGKTQLGKMLASAERMSTLIKDILAFSGLKKQEALLPTNLNVVLETVLQDLELMINQKKAVIQSDNLPVIEAIPLQMTQLFYNLINNSLKFTSPDRDPLIRISCRKMEEKERHPDFLKDVGYYELRFTDNGIGFGQEYTDQIFGLFKRLNDKQFYPGSGIGLALCKKVVDNHHGDIVASGKENAGAEFIVYLPERQVS